MSDATIADPTALITETTWFFLTVSDGICTRSDSVLVTVYELNCDEPDIFVPTPSPRTAMAATTALRAGPLHHRARLPGSMRWGEKVFETSDQNWAGTAPSVASRWARRCSCT